VPRRYWKNDRSVVELWWRDSEPARIWICEFDISELSWFWSWSCSLSWFRSIKSEIIGWGGDLVGAEDGGGDEEGCGGDKDGDGGGEGSGEGSGEGGWVGSSSLLSLLSFSMCFL